MNTDQSPEATPINPPVVRHLKPPPEIWELVQPVEPRPYSPRLAFLTRFRLSATSLILFAVVGGVVLGVGAAIFRVRGVQYPTTKETSQSLRVDSSAKPKDTPNQQSPAPLIENSTAQPTEVPIAESPALVPSHPIKRKANPAAEVQRTDIASSEKTVPVGSQTPRTDQQSKAATATDKKTTADPATAKPKATAALSPVVVGPPKAAPTPKAKVIQWP
jgi:hypothetical protein